MTAESDASAKGEKMTLAEVKKIPCNNLRDVPLMLRNLADQIEAGEWGDANKVVLAMEYQFEGEQKIDVFLWADVTPAEAFLLLHRSASKIGDF